MSYMVIGNILFSDDPDRIPTYVGTDEPADPAEVRRILDRVKVKMAAYAKLPTAQRSTFNGIPIRTVTAHE